MDKNELTKVGVDNGYSPSTRLREFVFKSFEVGSLSKAEGIVGYTRAAFYKQLNTNPKFSLWYSKQLNILSQGLMAKALKTLEEVMDNTESQGARVNAARTTLALSGRLRVRGGNVDVEREAARPVTLINQFNQFNQVNITLEDYTKAIEHAEAMGVPREEIEEAKRLRDAEFSTKEAESGADMGSEEQNGGENGDRFTGS